MDVGLNSAGRDARQRIDGDLQRIGTPDCRKWAAGVFGRHPAIDGYLKSGYIRAARSHGHVAANSELRQLNERLLWAGGPFSCSMDDDSIQSFARTQAIKCDSLVKSAPDLYAMADRLRGFCELSGVVWPLKLKLSDSAEQRRQKMLNAAARVVDDRWWRKQLRVAMGRQCEAALRGIGSVRRGKSPYVSNWAFARWRSAQLRNGKLLAGLEAVNEDDQAVPLAVCVEASVSNPVNRRNELMVRMRGYEEVATGLELVGLMLTLTCPSKYHAQLESGGRNPKFNGATPIDAMRYLNGVWQRIRSAWARQGIKPFGFRVAEPHHDGTPHFHVLIFVSPVERDRVCDIFGRYALAEDGDEPGALERRWDVREIEPALGSAAGYLAKYVAKNIDGYRVGVDEEGGCAADEGALRARAWASVWGIRQFQQVGCVSVTVWRELRRRRDPFEEMNPAEVEALRSAADRGEWREFVELMGGPMVRRDEQPLRPLYVEAERQTTRYGEPLRRLIGLWLRPVAHALGRCLVQTRDHVWKIQRRDLSRCNQVAAQPPPLDLCQ